MHRTWSIPCYANRSILDVGLQICLQCIQHPNNTREEKEEKTKEQRLKDQGKGEAKEQQEAIMSMEREKRKHKNRAKFISKEQKK